MLRKILLNKLGFIAPLLGGALIMRNSLFRARKGFVTFTRQLVTTLVSRYSVCYQNTRRT